MVPGLTKQRFVKFAGYVDIINPTMQLPASVREAYPEFAKIADLELKLQTKKEEVSPIEEPISIPLPIDIPV